MSRPMPHHVPDVVASRSEHEDARSDVASARSTGSLSLNTVSLFWNAGLCALFAILTYLLWSWSMERLTYVGGLPVPSLDWLMAVVNAPDLLPRIQAYVMVWVYGVLAAGSGLMTVMGIRSVLIRLAGPRMDVEGRR